MKIVKNAVVSFDTVEAEIIDIAEDIDIIFVDRFRYVDNTSKDLQIRVSTRSEWLFDWCKEYNNLTRNRRFRVRKKLKNYIAGVRVKKHTTEN